jgi:hypothetical protein
MEPDIAELENQMAAVEASIQAFTSGLSEAQATTQPPDNSWSVAGCLDHLARTNRAYLANMLTAATSAREKRKMRRSPAKPSALGRFFVSLLEPPVKPGRKIKAPATIHPPATVTLAEASASFRESQQEIRTFLHANADLDLARVTFRNPFIPGIRFSLATGICNLLAHERRHLWQAQRAIESLNAIT